MKNEFKKGEILNRIKTHYSLRSNSELAVFLGVAKNTISNWYTRNSIDYDLIFTKCSDVDFKWLLTGTNEKVEELLPQEYQEIDPGINDLNDNREMFETLKEFNGMSSLYKYLLKKYSFEKDEEKYDNILSEIIILSALLKHYNLYDQFYSLYSDFKKKKITQEQLFKNFENLIEKTSALLNIIFPYRDSIKTLYEVVDDFNEKNDNLFPIE